LPQPAWSQDQGKPYRRRGTCATFERGSLGINRGVSCAPRMPASDKPGGFRCSSISRQSHTWRLDCGG
jgi:hypothetical protein